MTSALSLGEIDALCVKAARGAGFSWGMAQEAGKAARTLALWDVRWEDALTRHLMEIEGDIASHAPRFEGGVWTAAPNAQCPICLGVALMDFGHALSEEPISIAALRHPVLLLPFLGAIAAARGGHVELGIGPREFRISAAGIDPDDPPQGRRWMEAWVCHDPKPLSWEPRYTASPYAVDADALAILERLAHRTYVPESEESRTSGAGAGTYDND